MDPSTPPTETIPRVEVSGPATPPIVASAEPQKHNSAVEMLGNFITIGLLIVFFPLGLILMWFFTKWPKIVKIIVTIFFLMIGVVLIIVGRTVTGGLQSGAKDAQRRTDMQVISKVMEEHFDVNAGQYLPPQPDWFSGGKIPQDPTGQNYQGLPTTPSTQYKICTTLENATLPSAPKEYCVENQR